MAETTVTYFELLEKAVSDFLEVFGDASCPAHQSFDIQCLSCCGIVAGMAAVQAMMEPDQEAKEVWAIVAESLYERFEELVAFYSRMMQN